MAQPRSVGDRAVQDIEVNNEYDELINTLGHAFADLNHMAGAPLTEDFQISNLLPYARLINDFIGLSVGVASAASAIKPEVEGLALAPINHLPPNPFTGALADKTCRTFPFQSGHHLCNSAIILWVSAILFWRMFIHALYSNLNPWFYRHTNSLCFSLG
eukprot:GHVT01001109.1.p1 GENE.GHVT01001109.1~~GHVT01001109.1.p1  ORF type:complete len:159 (+),score=3.08 GHVT01001109.1:219-695(+)